MNNETNFFDKTGKPIRIGDVLQIRLGKFAKKNGGPVLVRVIRVGKHVHFVPASQASIAINNWPVKAHDFINAVIVERIS